LQLCQRGPAQQPIRNVSGDRCAGAGAGREARRSQGLRSQGQPGTEARDSHFQPEASAKPGTAIFCQLGQPYRSQVPPKPGTAIFCRPKPGTGEARDSHFLPVRSAIPTKPGTAIFCQLRQPYRSQVPKPGTRRSQGQPFSEARDSHFLPVRSAIPKPGTEARDSEARDSHFLPVRSAIQTSRSQGLPKPGTAAEARDSHFQPCRSQGQPFSAS